MKKSIITVTLIIILILSTVVLFGCAKINITDETTCNMYVVNDDGSQELVVYTVTSFDIKNIAITKEYLADGTHITTIKNGTIEHTDAYTDQVKAETDEKLGVVSLLGSGSDDLDYTSKKDDDGNIIEEVIASKSGAYPTVKMVYEYN